MFPLLPIPPSPTWAVAGVTGMVPPARKGGGGQDKSACSPATFTRPSKDNLVLTVTVPQPNTRWKSPPNHLTLGAPAKGRVPVGF